MTGVVIKPQNISEPSDKVLRMYEAVHGFMVGKRDLSTVKVVDITSAAGIGKGTAYEYFSSKEEIIASAMTYEYKTKITELVECMFAQQGFKKRVMNVMEWIFENQEYNQLFSHIFREILGEKCLFSAAQNSIPPQKEMEPKEDAEKSGIMGEGIRYINTILSQLMSEAYEEGVITEADPQRRNITVFSAMVQYGCMLMIGKGQPLQPMTDAQLRDFIYTNIIKCLN